MAPTHHDNEIEGRSYKDYGYSSVPVSSSSAVFDAATPDEESVQLNAVNDKDELCRMMTSNASGTRNPEDVAEKGSKLIQFLAAITGESVAPPSTKGRVSGKVLSPVEQRE